MAKINIHNASFLCSAGTPEQFITDQRPQIAISGRSNVGKSSLINTLLGRRSMARVSSMPGKTITVNYFDIDHKMYLVDLPGYGFARRSPEEKKAWSALTDGYFVKNPHAHCIRSVIQLVDIRVGPTEDDVMMMQYMIDAHLPFFVVATKCDKLSKTAVSAAIAEWQATSLRGTGITIIPFSSVTRLGQEQVWNEIFLRVR